MAFNYRKEAEKMKKFHIRRRWKKRALSALSFVMITITVYMLMLPAIAKSTGSDGIARGAEVPWPSYGPIQGYADIMSLSDAADWDLRSEEYSIDNTIGEQWQEYDPSPYYEEEDGAELESAKDAESAEVTEAESVSEISETTGTDEAAEKTEESETAVKEESETEAAESAELSEQSEVMETETSETEESVEETKAAESVVSAEETEAAESVESAEETEAPETLKSVEETEAHESEETVEEKSSVEEKEVIEEKETTEDTGLVNENASSTDGANETPEVPETKEEEQQPEAETPAAEGETIQETDEPAAVETATPSTASASDASPKEESIEERHTSDGALLLNHYLRDYSPVPENSDIVLEYAWYDEYSDQHSDYEAVSEWIELVDTDRIRMKVYYEGIEPGELYESGSVLEFQLPYLHGISGWSILDEVNGSKTLPADIVDREGEVIGTLEISEQDEEAVRLHFDERWVKRYCDKNDFALKGSFWLEADIEVEEIEYVDIEGLSFNYRSGEFDSIAFANFLGFSAFSLGDDDYGIAPASANTGLKVDPYIIDDGVTVKWHRNSTEDLPWLDLPTAAGETVPADAYFRISVKYSGVDPATLQANNYKLIYESDSVMESLRADGNIKVAGENRGTISAQNIGDKDVIVLEFDHDWVDRLAAANEKTASETNKKKISGEFYYEGGLDVSKVDNNKQPTLNFGNIQINIPTDDDTTAKYAEVNVEKACSGTLITETDSNGQKHYYMEYTLKVSAGKHGSPAVSVVDTVINDYYFKSYVGVTGEKVTTGTGAQTAAKPVEQFVTGSGSRGTVFLSASAEPTAGSSYYTPSASGSHMVWEIGDMAANEVRTLTYRIELKPEYVGIAHKVPDDKTNAAVTNDAEVFSKTYTHGKDTSRFEPRANATLNKKLVSRTETSTPGVWKLDYEIEVIADSNNTYPLENVKVHDNFNSVPEAYRNQISYNADSIKLYGEDKTTQISLTGLRKGSDTNPVVTNNNNDKRLDVYIGDLEPGEKKYVNYSATMNVTEATKTANGQVAANNWASVHDDDTRGGLGNQNLAQKNVITELDYMQWLRKLTSSMLREESSYVIPSGKRMYDATEVTASHPLSLTETVNASDLTVKIPSGAYPYTVVVNEKGEWNVSSAAMKDMLGQGLQFSGYIAVKVFDRLTDDRLTGNDDAMIRYLNNQTPKDTIYIKVDGLSNFELKGTQIGLNFDDSDAYVISYYAVPDEYGLSSEKIEVSNDFKLEGTVYGPGNRPLVLSGIHANKTVTVVGNSNFSTEKQFWYYEAPDETKPEFDKGALYWAIKIDGSRIKGIDPNTNHGTQFQESANDGSWNNLVHGFMNINFDGTTSKTVKDTKDDDSNWSFLGFYSGNLEGKTIQEAYTSFDDVIADNRLTKVPQENYSLKWTDVANSCKDFTVEIVKDLTIDAGHSLYLLVRTEPKKLPSQTERSVTYKNKVNYRYASSNVGSWPNSSTEYTMHADSNGLYKLGQGVYVVKTEGNTKSFKKVNDEGKLEAINTTDAKAELQSRLLLKDYTTYNNNSSNFNYQDGTYVSWLITINKTKALSGIYTVEDYLPKGVELEYVRAFGFEDNEQLEGLYNEAPLDRTGEFAYQIGRKNEAWSSEWSEHYVASSLGQATTSWNSVGNYYYTKKDSLTGQDRLRLSVKTRKNAKPAVVQVVCRVTDPAINFEDVEFVNQAELYNSRGEMVDKRTGTIIARTNSLSKDYLKDEIEKQDGKPDVFATNLIPYQLVINDLGQDIAEDSDVIPVPLVDRMGSNMTADMSTMRIYVDSFDDKHPEQNLIYSGEMVNGAVKGNIANSLAGETPNIRVSLEDRADGGTDMLFHNMPDSKKLIIRYKVSLDMKQTETPSGDENTFSNDVFWKGYKIPEGGKTEIKNAKYNAGAIAWSSQSGGALVTKQDGANTSITLSGAKFGLYEVTESGSTLSLGAKLAEGTTGSDGKLSFGALTPSHGTVGEGSNDQGQPVEVRGDIFFNKIYAIQELTAPTGYNLDTKIHYFVIPSDTMKEHGEYRTVWPDGVHVCTRTAGSGDNVLPTYLLEVSDYKPSVKVTKNFAGNHGLEGGFKPGSYTFGIYPETYNSNVNVVDGEPVAGAYQLDRQTLIYTEEDLTQDTEGNAVLNQKFITFSNLDAGMNYWIYELNDVGEPIVDRDIGTIGGTKFQVEYNNAYDSAYSAYFPQVQGGYHNVVNIPSGAMAEPVLETVNKRYRIDVTKRFKNSSGELMENGVAGTYRFGLWSADKVNAETKQVSGSPIDIQEITWELTDNIAEKTISFTDVEKDKSYYVFELNGFDVPIWEGSAEKLLGTTFSPSYTKVIGTEMQPGMMVTITDQSEDHVIVTNCAVISLPRTGGTGTKWFTWSGVLLILAACSLYGYRMRNKSERRFLP